MDDASVRTSHAVETRCLLYVEDDDDVREMMTSFFEDAGFEVTSAPSAHMGLALLRARRFKLVVTDQMIPGETGGAMLLRAKAEGLLTGETRAVIVTANMHGNRIDRPDGVPVFQKPLEIEPFLRALAELVTPQRE